MVYTISIALLLTRLRALSSVSPISSPKSFVLQGDFPLSLILASGVPVDTSADMAGLIHEKNCTRWSYSGKLKCNYLDNNSTIRLSAKIIPIASRYSNCANFSTSRHSQSPHSRITERHTFTVCTNSFSSFSDPVAGPGTFVRI